MSVSNRTPGKGRGIRVALKIPGNVAPSEPPVLRLKDKKGREYRSQMSPGSAPGEWYWKNGLDEPGAWQGTVIVRQRKKAIEAALPSIKVSN